MVKDDIKIDIDKLKKSFNNRKKAPVDELKQIKSWGVLAIWSVLGLMLLFGSFNIIDSGERGVVLRLGKVVRTMDAGLNLKIPVIEAVVKYPIRTVVYSVEASSASRDLQDVKTNIALNYHADPTRVSDIYSSLGRLYQDVFIAPAIQETVKATTAKYNAEELITNRSVVKDAIETSLKQRLEAHGIMVDAVSITNFDFSEEFNHAIEAKVVAQQLALKAANDLNRVEVEKQIRITQAQGEAEAIRIQAQSINSQGGEDYVKLKAIEKWSGVLPQYVMGSAIPFIQIPTG